jgi:hypothetical protein
VWNALPTCGKGSNVQVLLIIDEFCPEWRSEQARTRPSWVENQWVDVMGRDPYFPRALGIHPGPAGAFC